MWALPPRETRVMGLPRAMRLCSATLRGAADRVRQPDWSPELVVKAGSHQEKVKALLLVPAQPLLLGSSSLCDGLRRS
jgi:hypothetical protein